MNIFDDISTFLNNSSIFYAVNNSKLELGRFSIFSHGKLSLTHKNHKFVYCGTKWPH